MRTLLLVMLSGCTCALTHQRDAAADPDAGGDAGMLDDAAIDAGDDGGADAGSDAGPACDAPVPLHPDLTRHGLPIVREAFELPDLGVIVGLAVGGAAEEPVLFTYDLATDTAHVLEG